MRRLVMAIVLTGGLTACGGHTVAVPGPTVTTTIAVVTTAAPPTVTVTHTVNAAPVTVTAPAPRTVEALDCAGGTPAVRPVHFVLGTCADGGDSLIDMRWTEWSLSGAKGTGLQALNQCTPDCAAGVFTYYAAVVSMSGLAPADAAGVALFTSIRVTADGHTFTISIPVGKGSR